MELPIKIDMTPPALLRALADHIERQAPATLVKRPESLPRVGNDWPSEGGRFVGIIRKPGEEMDRAVIVCTDKAGDFDDHRWGSTDTEIGATSDYWGEPNTRAMAEAGNQVAKQVLALELGGHKDWYIPARQELVLCFMHAQDLFRKEWYWSSTQYSSLSAWMQDFALGYVGVVAKDCNYRVRAVRTIPL